MLIGGRVVASIGASGLINGALTIIAASLPLERRACKYIVLCFNKVKKILRLITDASADRNYYGK